MCVRAFVAVMYLALALVPAGAQEPQPAAPVQSAVPRMMWLSGVFRPVTLQPIASVESVTVAIYRDREGGDALWQETQSVAMEPGGRYSLLMGSTAADGLPLDSFTSGEPRWMGITFNRPGEVEQPRVPMASVPYALKAADADTLGGLPASAYLRAGAPASRSNASRSSDGVSMQTSGQGGAEGITPLSSGTPGYLGMFTDSTNLGNSVLYQSGSAIALGATVPRDMFHVSFTNGNGALTGYGVQNLSGAANAYSGMLFYDQNNALGLFQGFNNVSHEYRINNVASGGSISFRIAGTPRFTVANNGNIGISVPVPTSKLDVAGNINASTHYSLSGVKMLSAASSIDSVFVGANSGPAATSAFYNSFFGTATGFNTLSNANTFIGYHAGFRNTTGCCNTILGAFSGGDPAVAPGDANTLLGYLADFGVAGLTNATAIGAQSIVSQSNSLILGSINGVHFATADTNVGIGTTAPSRKFHMSGEGSNGAGMTDLRITGTGAIGSGLTVESTGTGGRTYSWISTADNTGGGGFGPGKFAVFDVTGGAYRMVIDEVGRVGIGTFDPDMTLSVSGEANKIGGGFWDVFSDERLKNVKGPFTPGIDVLMQLQPIRFEYKPDNALGLKSTREYVGFGAHAVQQILPEAVSTNDKGYLLINNEPILLTMLNAIQQQQREIQDQRRRADEQLTHIQHQQTAITALQQQNLDLERRLAALEAALSGRR